MLIYLKLSMNKYFYFFLLKFLKDIKMFLLFSLNKKENRLITDFSNQPLNLVMCNSKQLAA